VRFIFSIILWFLPFISFNQDSKNIELYSQKPDNIIFYSLENGYAFQCGSESLSIHKDKFRSKLFKELKKENLEDTIWLNNYFKISHRKTLKRNFYNSFFNLIQEGNISILNLSNNSYLDDIELRISKESMNTIYTFIDIELQSDIYVFTNIWVGTPIF
jgi:hypothetical protein